MGKLDDEIAGYCKLNGIDIETYKSKILQIGFNIDRYGSKPQFISKDVNIENKDLEDNYTKNEGDIKKYLDRIEELEKVEKELRTVINRDETNNLYGD